MKWNPSNTYNSPDIMFDTWVLLLRWWWYEVKHIQWQPWYAKNIKIKKLTCKVNSGLPLKNWFWFWFYLCTYWLLRLDNRTNNYEILNLDLMTKMSKVARLILSKNTTFFKNQKTHLLLIFKSKRFSNENFLIFSYFK